MSPRGGHGPADLHLPSQELDRQLRTAGPLKDPGPSPHRPASSAEAEAAVLVLLRGRPGSVEVLLIQRAERAGDPWSGHVALPGGRRDQTDPGLAATALREAHEEVGLEEAWLEGPPIFVGTRVPANRPSLHVGVFLAVLRHGGPEAFRSSEEVDAVFWMPVLQIAHTEPGAEVSTPAGRFQVEGVRFQGRLLWGLTRRILLDVMGSYGELLVGGERPPGASSPSSEEGS